MLTATIRKGVFAALALAAAAVIAAPASAQVKGDGGKVRLTYNPAGTQSFPPYVIQKFGLDKKYGFQLELTPTVTPQATIMQAGGTDIALMGWTDVARLRKANFVVRGIAPFLTWANTVVVPIDSPVKTLGDLKGKKVGIFSRISLDWITMRAAAKKQYGIELEEATTYQEGAVTLLRGLIESGQLDATQMFNDLTPPMLATGKFRVLNKIKDYIETLGLPDTPFLVYVTSDEYAKAKPANVKAFVAAYHEAMDILQKNDDIWKEKGAELKITDEAVIKSLRDQTRPVLMAKFLPTTEADIKKTYAVLVQAAGNDILGINPIPDGLLSLDYQ